jgi:hypothetical protein
VASAVAFTTRALAWFKDLGVPVERIMTDNGSAYRNFALRDLPTEKAIRHKRTRSYTPRTKGKAERFIQTSLREWAYASAFETSHQRPQALKPFPLNYNTVRTHSGIAPPNAHAQAEQPTWKRHLAEAMVASSECRRRGVRYMVLHLGLRRLRRHPQRSAPPLPGRGSLNSPLRNCVFSRAGLV